DVKGQCFGVGAGRTSERLSGVDDEVGRRGGGSQSGAAGGLRADRDELIDELRGRLERAVGGFRAEGGDIEIGLHLRDVIDLLLRGQDLRYGRGIVGSHIDADARGDLFVGASDARFDLIETGDEVWI